VRLGIEETGVGNGNMLIVDLNSISARCFYATHYNSPTMNRGIFYNAFLRCLFKVLKVLIIQHEAVVLCIDSRSYRKDIYAGYKAKEHVQGNIAYGEYKDAYTDICLDMKKSLPFYVVKKEGYEADDLVAYFAYINSPATIVSQDKDLKPLTKISGITYYNFVEEKTEQLEDVDLFLHTLVCQGDSSDGVPSIIPRDAAGKLKYSLGPKTIANNYDVEACCRLAPQWWEKIAKEDKPIIIENYNRNRQLIDLSLSRVHKEFIKPERATISAGLIEDFFRFYAPGFWQTDSYPLNSLLWSCL
jgi:hypothetical protein